MAGDGSTPAAYVAQSQRQQRPIFGRLYRSDGTIIALIGVMNSINHSFGKSATRLCSGGAEQCWKMRTNNKSPNCTTRITALVIAKAG